MATSEIIISNKTKLAVGALLCGGAYLSYDYYQKNSLDGISKPITDEELESNLKDAAKNYGKGDDYKGIYLYSQATSKIYLRSNDGKFYRAGTMDSCPYLSSPDNTVTIYEITDIYNTISCKNLPPQYQKKYGDSCKDDKGSIQVMITSADDFEKKINDSAVGDIIPSPSICNPPSDVKGLNNFGGFDMGFSNFKECLEKNWPMLLEMVGQVGLFMAVAKFNLLFAIGMFVIPGIFKGKGWESQKSGIMTGQIALHWAVGKLQEIYKVNIDGVDSKALVDASDGAIEGVSEKIAIGMARDMGTALFDLGMKMVSIIGKMCDGLIWAQMLGMLLDVFDFCHLNTVDNNISQDLLDKWAVSNQLGFENALGFKMQYPNMWNPVNNYCDYDLDPNKCSLKFKNCNSQSFLKGQKWGDGIFNDNRKPTEITEADYCGDETGKDGEFNKYVNEYLDKLTVNAFGQCIETISNKQMAQMLQDKMPDYDFSPIAGVTKDNYITNGLFPTNDYAKMFSIFLVNQNVVAAEFVKDNFYYFLSLFIVILLIIFLI